VGHRNFVIQPEDGHHHIFVIPTEGRNLLFAGATVKASPVWMGVGSGPSKDSIRMRALARAI
jgi:hypothetical protein